MFLLLSNNDIAALKGAVKEKHSNWSWGEKKREYLVDLGIGRILLNALVRCTVSSDLRRSSSSKLEFSMFRHHKRIRCLH